MNESQQSPSRAAIFDRLSDRERANVRAFRDQVQSMWAAAPTRADGRRVLLEVEKDFDWTMTTATTPPRLKETRVTAPTDDGLAALLVRLRRFMQQGEDLDCNYYVIRNLISQHLNQAGITRFHQWFRAAKQGSDLQIVQALGLNVTGRELLDVWLNGVLFHTEVPKREKFTRLQQTYGEGRIRIALMIAVGALQDQIIELHEFIESHTDIYEGLAGE